MSSETLLGRRRRSKSKRIRRRVLLLLLVSAAVPVLFSYVRMLLRPSSLPLGIRTVEWIRANHGAWAVNDAERFWYSHHAPRPGGPTLTSLPEVGVRPSLSSRTRRGGAYPVRQARWRPPPILPLIRPVLSGEGRWQRTSALVHGAAPVLVTTFRPDPIYPRIVAYVAWIDHTRTQLALYPGRYEPPKASPRGPMEVPLSQRVRLLATFNSGFTYRDGHGGFAIGGHVATPFRDHLGTVVAYRNGRVDVVSWRGSVTPADSVVFARQNLPLIVNRGHPNPNLSDGRAWGATLGNAIRVWRSGVGIDRHGNLIYAAANYQTVGTLAAILIHAGAVRAIELDINAEWPSFISYPRAGARDPLKIVPNYQQPATRYLVPDDRDFFAVYRRLARAGAQVPFR